MCIADKKITQSELNLEFIEDPKFVLQAQKLSYVQLLEFSEIMLKDLHPSVYVQKARMKSKNFKPFEF